MRTDNWLAKFSIILSSRAPSLWVPRGYHYVGRAHFHVFESFQGFLMLSNIITWVVDFDALENFHGLLVPRKHRHIGHNRLRKISRVTSVSWTLLCGLRTLKHFHRLLVSCKHHYVIYVVHRYLHALKNFRKLPVPREHRYVAPRKFCSLEIFHSNKTFSLC